MTDFIGRKYELKTLEDLSAFKRPRLVVIRGRRRVGKSRLVKEYAKGKRFLEFSGLAPAPKVTAQKQRDEFANQLAQQVQVPPFRFSDWTDALAHLSLHLDNRPTVVLFDEISWIGAKDPTFVPKLKIWWDTSLQQYTNLTLIFCGSVSTWITKNIINSTAFFGRITLNLDLPELFLPEAYQLLKANGFSGSTYDALKILSITGGVPWYIEQILPNHTADENIKRLCFLKNGLLVNEFDKMFNDLFLNKADIYKKIVTILADGMKTASEIRIALQYCKSGTLSKLLKNLLVSGFISEHFNWSFKTGTIAKQKLYRLSDNYLRFFLKYIEPNLAKIQSGLTFINASLADLPGWETMLGFQVESLILKNRVLLQAAIGINSTDIVADNPYIQRATTRHKGCQIDYLIQTYTENLFIFEFKYNRRELNAEVIEDVKEKIKRLATPKGFGRCAVLVHTGDLAAKVYEKQFFYRCIDVRDLLEGTE